MTREELWAEPDEMLVWKLRTAMGEAEMAPARYPGLREDADARVEHIRTMRRELRAALLGEEKE